MRDVVDELDDELRLPVAGRRLAGEDLHARHPVALGLRAHRVVQRDRLQDVQQLPLVLVDALDVDVEQRIRIEADAQALGDDARQRDLVRAPHRGEALAQRGVARERGQRLERVGVVQHLRADRLDDQARQPGIGLVQPAAERDAVGLVDDAVADTAHAGRGTPCWRMSSVCSADTPLTRCEPTKARWPIRTWWPLFSSISDTDDRKAASSRPSARRASRWRVSIAIDDLHVPRQQPLHQRHGPALERLGQQRVIGVIEDRRGDRPRAGPTACRARRPAGA